MIIFKLFLLTPDREKKKKSSNFFPPSFQKSEKLAVALRKGLVSGGKKKSYHGGTFPVFRVQFCWYIHAMVADKVVNHFQLAKEVFFIKRLASEMKPNRIKDFLVLDSREVGFLGFLSYFLKLATAFTTRPKPVKEAKTTGFKVMPLAIAEVITALPAQHCKAGFFFERRGTAFRSRNVSCCSRHEGFSTFLSYLSKGLCRCG